MPSEKIILELHSTGDRLDFTNTAEASEIESLLNMAISSFYEAHAALWLFEDAVEADWLSWQSGHDQTQSEIDRDRRRQIEDQLKRIHGDSRELYDQAALIFKREQWQQGKLPRDIKRKFTFIHAHSFLFAIDSIGRFLGVVKSHAGVPAQAQDAAKRFDDELPQVREIRNSAHHKEDRIRRQGPNKKPIPRRSVSGGAMVMSSLHNNTLEYTTVDGHMMGIDVTLDTLFKIQSILQSTLDAFTWKGEPSHHPS